MPAYTAAISIRTSRRAARVHPRVRSSDDGGQTDRTRLSRYALPMPDRPPVRPPARARPSTRQSAHPPAGRHRAGRDGLGSSRLGGVNIFIGRGLSAPVWRLNEASNRCLPSFAVLQYPRGLHSIRLAPDRFYHPDRASRNAFLPSQSTRTAPPSVRPPVLSPVHRAIGLRPSFRRSRKFISSSLPYSVRGSRFPSAWMLLAGPVR